MNWSKFKESEKMIIRTIINEHDGLQKEMTTEELFNYLDKKKYYGYKNQEEMLRDRESYAELHEENFVFTYYSNEDLTKWTLSKDVDIYINDVKEFECVDINVLKSYLNQDVINEIVDRGIKLCKELKGS